MALSEAPRPAPFGAITIHRLVSLADAACSELRSWRIARQTETGLRALTDRELDDIGLFRGQLGDLADKMARYQR